MGVGFEDVDSGCVLVGGVDVDDVVEAFFGYFLEELVDGFSFGYDHAEPVVFVGILECGV
ncbi:MAG: hypothetical protein J07HQW1_00100, partial [Haloquadratum walsbyi J07HQW1]